MQKSSSHRAIARTVARFHWAVACERLDFALAPDDATPGMPPTDYGTALRLVENALAEVRAAYEAEGIGTLPVIQGEVDGATTAVLARAAARLAS